MFIDIQPHVYWLRRHYGRYGFRWDDLESRHCQLHSEAMLRKSDLYHAPLEFIGDWSEAIGRVRCTGHMSYDVAYMLGCGLARSEEHLRIILDSRVLAGAVIKGGTFLWVTIRGIE